MMKPFTTRLVAVGAATAAGLLPATLAHAAAHHPAAPPPTGIKTVVSGLSFPTELSFTGQKTVDVTQGGPGDVSRANISTGTVKNVFTNIPSLNGAAAVSPTKVFMVVGESPEKGSGFNNVLLQGNPKTGKVHQVANLLKFEKRHNPDGQKQSTGKNADALSNPYYVVKHGKSLLIADAAGNDVLAYRNHKLSLFHVFPNIRDTKKCKNAKNNDKRHPGCDPVPTGVAVGPHGNVYVSLLGAEQPKAGQVDELNGRTGKLMHAWKRLTTTTGVAVSKGGVVYASELEYGINSPGANFDNVGRVVRFARNGSRTYAPVATPTGMEFHDGHLYSSAHTGEELEGASMTAGEIDRVSPKAFKPGKKG